MLVESLYMVRSRKIDCLAGLPHQINEIDLQGRGLVDGLGNAIHEEIRDHACVERSRTHGDQISMLDRVNCFHERLRVTRTQAYGANRPAALADFAFASYYCAVVQRCFQTYIG